MSLEAIRAKIEEDAAAEARAIRAAAEADLEAAKTETRARLSVEYERDSKRLAADMDDLEARLGYHAARGFELEVENASRSIIDTAIDRAVERLASLPDAEYGQLIGTILGNCGMEGTIEVLISPVDENRLTQKFFDARSDMERRFVLSSERHGGRGGVILRSGRISLNATFSMAAALARESLVMDLAALLPGKD